MFEFLLSWLMTMGLEGTAASIIARLAILLIIAIIAILADIITLRYILRIIEFSVKRTENTWDDVLKQRKVFARLSRLAPAIVVILMIPLALTGYPDWITAVINIAYIYIICVGLLVANAFLDGVVEIYRSFDWSKEMPIRGFVQVFKIILALFGLLLIASIMLDETVLVILGSLGAATAILMLIFQDALLGLVAGVQLTANNMLARGDFISMPQYDAEGHVREIALTTVKVQNTDKSITTIPTNALITTSFKNWRGMNEAGGRRIKRSIPLDLNSIKPLSPNLRTKLGTVALLVETAEFETNLAAFRAYALAYLKQHPAIHQEGFNLLVRALEPTINGLPLEVIAFSNEMDWPTFEEIQGRLFEHLITMLPTFELSTFQVPAGKDV